MARLYNNRLLLFALLCVAVALALQAQNPVTVPSQEEARQAVKRHEKSLEQDRVQPPAPGKPDWVRARADADRLLTLVQQVHDHVHASPDQIPATLPGELRETQKLAKRIREELRM
jgi:hypothetical protein